ncbi:hypothetical protein UPYG_G00142100 [Umbra pygmaea]|uniref:THAP-type domain-containing protein n=1 Tax=Umbra pygmaea TaxID=75934 RepID=A0ABD0X039_UMBPY
MSKIERLNARVAKLLTVAVNEVLDIVKETVSEYQEKTARTQRENESLRRRLQELQERLKKETAGVAQNVAGQLELQNCKQEFSLVEETELFPSEEELTDILSPESHDGFTGERTFGSQVFACKPPLGLKKSRQSNESAVQFFRFPSDARLKQWISDFHRQAGQEEAEGHRCAYHFQISTTLVSKERKELRHTDQVGIQTE